MGPTGFDQWAEKKKNLLEVLNDKKTKVINLFKEESSRTALAA